MKKIKTIFNRNWEGDGKITKEMVVDSQVLVDAIATEKLDGTNVRITVRNHTVVRIEKRRNPTKIEKHKGIEEPWYMETTNGYPQDKWIFNGVDNTNFSQVPDGEWSGELIGTNIQGNPLNLLTNRIVFFSLGQAPTFEEAPTTYEELKEWLPKQKSKYGNDCGIEGIVWHCNNGSMYKIKTKDF